MRLLSVIGVFVLLAQLCVDAGASEIDWDSERPLTWDDFRGSVPRGADELRVATTASSIAWSYAYEIEWSPSNCAFSVVRLDSVAQFHTDRSWVRPGHRTAEILEHEQGHFDVAQIFNAKFLAATRELIGASRSCDGSSQRRARSLAEQQISEWVSAIYVDLWQQYERRQDDYDRETRHGIDREAQIEWTRSIAKSLAASP